MKLFAVKALGLCGIVLAALWTVSARAADVVGEVGSAKVTVADDTGEVAATLRAGTKRPGITLTLVWEDEKQTRIQVQTGAAKFTFKKEEKGKPSKEEVMPLQDAYVEFPELGIKVHVRPNLECYGAKAAEELVQRWDSLPKASAYEFPFSLRLDAKGAQYWIDGRYAGRVNAEARLKEVQFQWADDAAVTAARFAKRAEDQRFLSLDIARSARPGTMKDAEVSVKPGASVVGGVPFIVGAGKDNADVGVVKLMGFAAYGWDLDPYLARTGFDGMPESILYSVPLTQYTRAWLLCAMEDTPARDPIVTARLTRFLGNQGGGDPGRGDAIADTTVWLSRDGKTPTGGMKQVGTVSYPAPGGEKVVPLWLVEVPLKVGEIQDLVFIHKKEPWNAGTLPDRRYLDFELLGKLGRPCADGELTHRPDAASTSAVHIFGVTLERTPVEMEVRQVQVGNVFQGAEKRELSVALRTLEKGAYALKWTIRDVDGRTVADERKPLALEAGAEPQILPLPLVVQENGWYGVEVALEDGQGRRLVEHAAAFAVLPEDTRRAGCESPYGTWWFGKCHQGTDDPAIGGPLLLKAGLRHAFVDMPQWKLSEFMVPWYWWMLAPGDLAAATQKYEEAVSDYLTKHPHCAEALIFHESDTGGNGDAIPAELRGAAPAPMTEEQAKKCSHAIEVATAATKVLREKFPQLKIVFGSGSGAVTLLRAKYPKENIDYLGVETLGQTFMPEKPTEGGAEAAWYVRETGRKLGYDLPVTCCYEWIGREEHNLGAKRLAEWYARDALIAYAYHFTHIASLALLYDVGDGYYNSVWGATGLCRRYPLLYPKAAYVAYATLTRVLDDVKLVRRVPTGSATFYALEFTRDDQRIYALWTARGSCPASLRFASDATVTIVDLYGRARSVATRDGALTLEADTAAQYVISTVPVTEISAGPRTFPLDQPPAGLQAANAMDNIAEWQLASGKDDRLETPTRGYSPLRTAGTYLLRQVEDPEKGRCLELELTPKGTLPDIMNEYTLLNLKTPVLVPGRPTTVGVWVKGNSAWGRVMWSFTDAGGRKWLSSGSGAWGCDNLDWPGDISINFDGWCFLRFPITQDSPIRSISPGDEIGQWDRRPWAATVAYPIKLTGLAIEMTRKSLDLTEMAPVRPVLRFKDLCAY